MMKTWQVVSIFCVVWGWEIVSTESSDVKQCPIGTSVVEGKYLLPVNSSCKKCLLCHFSEDKNLGFIYLCPSKVKLNGCHKEMYLYMWSSKVKSWDTGVPWKQPREANIAPVIIQTTSKPAPLVPADHISQKQFLIILTLVSAPVLVLLIIIACLLHLTKRKKRMSLYGAISVQRRPQREDDENYVRYTKDPTSSASRHKDRVRASWPRSASRSENRYLLEVSSREPVPDTVSNGREENPDSNSAHYVFIQTFSAAASGSSSSAPLSSGTRALDVSPLPTETPLPEKVPVPNERSLPIETRVSMPPERQLSNGTPVPMETPLLMETTSLTGIPLSNAGPLSDVAALSKETSCSNVSPLLDVCPSPDKS